MRPEAQDTSHSIIVEDKLLPYGLIVADLDCQHIGASRAWLNAQQASFTHLELVADSRADTAWRSVASYAWSPVSYSEYVRIQ
jgi:hypothetical protein